MLEETAIELSQDIHGMFDKHNYSISTEDLKVLDLYSTTQP
jgi:hypothetical protein